MDPETEAKLAAMLMEEATRLRQRADKEGVGAYLAKPVARVRPNPQFMRATVQGVQQANRVVEINEMWRRRHVEVGDNHSKRARRSDRASGRQRFGRDAELRDDGRDSTREDDSRWQSSCRDYNSSPEKESRRGRSVRYVNSGAPEDSGESTSGSEDLRDGGEWKDDDIDQFLKSRAKRGRGAVGCRMDEPGPYLAPEAGPGPGGLFSDTRLKEDWEDRVLGPASGPSLMTRTSSAGREVLRKKKHRENGSSKSRLRHEARKEEKMKKKRETSKRKRSRE